MYFLYHAVLGYISHSDNSICLLDRTADVFFNSLLCLSGPSIKLLSVAAARPILLHARWAGKETAVNLYAEGTLAPTNRSVTWRPVYARHIGHRGAFSSCHFYRNIHRLGKGNGTGFSLHNPFREQELLLLLARALGGTKHWNRWIGCRIVCLDTIVVHN
jgi:hypothetical protein